MDRLWGTLTSNIFCDRIPMVCPSSLPWGITLTGTSRLPFLGLFNVRHLTVLFLHSSAQCRVKNAIYRTTLNRNRTRSVFLLVCVESDRPCLSSLWKEHLPDTRNFTRYWATHYVSSYLYSIECCIPFLSHWLVLHALWCLQLICIIWN